MSKKHRNEQAVAVEPAPAQPTDAEAEQRERLFKDTYDELVRKQISNSENFDKSVLTLSTFGLGLSLTFIKDIAPLAQAHARFLLILSWVLFGLAIIATISSFMTSQAAIRFQIDVADKYYRERKNEYLGKTSIWSEWTDKLNWSAGATFIAAIILTIVFVVLNLPPTKP